MISDDFNLEDEYGDLLDHLEDYISKVEPTVEHFGVKGMKWGIRKDRPVKEPLKSLGPDSVSRKTKNGETITLQKVTPNKLHEFLGRRSKKYREEYSKQAMLNILDGSGKKVGDAMVQKKNNEELYLEWLGINKSARGKGYATAVMQAGRDFGKQEGFNKMVLEVPGNSPDARHIYEKIGFKYVGEVDGGHKDPFWGGLSKMEYNFDEVKHGELIHYGVKGMKWGVRKAVSDRLEARAKTKRAENKPNKNYTSNMRKRDQYNFGTGGVKRINRRMNQGSDLKTARKKETRFQKNRKRAVSAGIGVAKTYHKRKEIAATLFLVGGVLAQQVAVRAETKRGQAVAAASMGLPRRASDGPTRTKPNRKGVYNISSL